MECRSRVDLSRFCRDFQRKKDAGTLDPPSDHDIYDWDSEKPTRKLINWIDKAPYLGSVQVQLSSTTKKEYAKSLGALGVKYIKVKRGDASHNIEVPQSDAWRVGEGVSKRQRIETSNFRMHSRNKTRTSKISLRNSKRMEFGTMHQLVGKLNSVHLTYLIKSS